jgi:hypothetical protein
MTHADAIRALYDCRSSRDWEAIGEFLAEKLV